MRPNKLHNLFSYSSVPFPSFPRVPLVRKMEINTSPLNLSSPGALAHPATALRRATDDITRPGERARRTRDHGDGGPELANTPRLSVRAGGAGDRGRGGGTHRRVLQQGGGGRGVKERGVREEGTKESRREP